MMGMFGLYTMNAVDIFLWSLLFYLIFRLIETKNPLFWIWIGFVIGIGLLNKISMGWIAAGLFVGVLATPLRSWLKTPYPWIAAGIALLLFSPYIIWNVQHDFAHLEFAGNASRNKYASQNAMTFFSGLFVNYNPLTAPLWLSGFWILFRRKEREYRALFYAILTVLAILLINVHSKSEYFNPAMVILSAAGSVGLERILNTFWKKAAAWVYLGLIVLTGALLTPFAIDILPVKTFISYIRASGQQPVSAEGIPLNDLPQHFADRFGWREMAVSVSRAYESLSDEEKKQTLIFGQNYGEASAVNFYGKELGLPKAISGHNSYWVWGPGNTEPEVIIIIGGNKQGHEQIFESVEESLVHTHPYAISYESNLPIYICKGLTLPIDSAWVRAKHYN